MTADAAAEGKTVTARLVRDWTEQGLLDYPRKQPAGKGHGSSQALYSANQRMLFLTLLDKRPGQNVSSLARIPFAIWLYWGDEWVPMRQARRALMRHLGDPGVPSSRVNSSAISARNYATDALRASKEKSREAARAVLGQLDNPRATQAARRRLVDVLAEASYTGSPNFDAVEQAIRDVFEAGYQGLHRAIGHPSAPVTADGFIIIARARLTAISDLAAGRVSDEAFVRARESLRFGYAEYVARWRTLDEASPPGTHLYGPVTAEDTLANCCGHFLSTLGMEILYPADAERLRRARTGQRHPAACEHWGVQDAVLQVSAGMRAVRARTYQGCRCPRSWCR